MEDIRTYLSDDASDEERRAAELLKEGLSALRLQKKVEAVAAERAALERNGRNRRWFGILLLIVAILAAVWLFKKNTTDGQPVPSDDPPPGEEQFAPPSDEIETLETVPNEEIPEEPSTPTTAPSPPPNIPIAQTTPEPGLPPPAHAAPGTYLRGQSQEQEGKAKLDQLWYTSYPLEGFTPGERFEEIDQLLRDRTFTTAYVRLQRLERQLASNDSLRYLQAYTLLEMGQGQEAKFFLDEIESAEINALPQLQWYRGLALLLSDDKDAALTIFRELAADSDHPYQQHAKKALELYQ